MTRLCVSIVRISIRLNRSSTGCLLRRNPSRIFDCLIHLKEARRVRFRLFFSPSQGYISSIPIGCWLKLVEKLIILVYNIR